MPRRGIPNEFLNGADGMRGGSLISRATSTPSPSSSSFHRDPFSFGLLPSSWNLIFLWRVFGKSLVRFIAISWFLIRFILFLVFDKWCAFFFFLFNNDYCSRRVIHLVRLTITCGYWLSDTWSFCLAND